MLEFVIEGPYPVSFLKTNKVKRISEQNVPEFWQNCPDDLPQQKGCYVFALRNRSIKPFYVGKASKGFYQEIFTSHKLEKYNDVLHSHIHGSPIFYFVTHPLQRGKVNEKAIDEIETYLIQSALIVNPELRNIQKTKLPSWTIRNVISKVQGKSRKNEKDFARMLRLL